MDKDKNIIEDVTNNDYKYGFVTDIETEFIEKGLNENIIRHISKVKQEPEWLLEFRLKAYRKFITMKQPNWAHLNIPPIDSVTHVGSPAKSSLYSGVLKCLTSLNLITN